MQINPSTHRKPSPCLSQGWRNSSAQRRRFDPPSSIFHPPSSILHPLSSIVTGRQTHRRGPILFESVPALRSPKTAPRGAFTLIELLVVVTIIAILMSFLISIVGAFLTQARDAATKSTLNKIQGLTNSRAQAMQRLTMRKGFVTTTDPLQKVVGMKVVEARYFPQRVVEISATDQPALWTAYNNQFSLGGNLASYLPANDPKHILRSSEILYNFLTQSNVLGDTPITTDAFSDAEVKDTDGNGLPEFVDAWGNPLRFYRWPTRFFRSGGVTGPAPGTLQGITPVDVSNAKLLFTSLPVFSGNLASDLNRDPDDPLRVCVGNANFNALQFEAAFHTPATYHVLLIVSAGPDGQLGIYEPDFIDVTNNIYGNLAQPIPDLPNQNINADQRVDNITYLNVRAGGK